MRVQVVIEPYADYQDELAAMGLTEDACHDLYDGMTQVGNIITITRLDDEPVRA